MPKIEIEMTVGWMRKAKEGKGKKKERNAERQTRWHNYLTP